LIYTTLQTDIIVIIIIIVVVIIIIIIVVVVIIIIIIIIIIILVITVMVVVIDTYFSIYIQQDATLHSIFDVFRVVFPPIIRSAYSTWQVAVTV
jgi:hypothetical protein